MNTSLLTPDSLANRWNITSTTLSQWRWNGRGPRYIKLGSRVMYRAQDIEHFESLQLRQNTSSILPQNTSPALTPYNT